MIQKLNEYSGNYWENEKKKWKIKFMFIDLHHKIQELEKNKY